MMSDGYKKRWCKDRWGNAPLASGRQGTLMGGTLKPQRRGGAGARDKF